MKNSSKLTALIVALMLLLSVNVSAKVSYDVPAQNLVSQNFAGLSELPTDWEVKKHGVNMTTYFNAKGLTTGDSTAATPTTKNGNLYVGYNNEFNANNTDYSANIKFAKISQNTMAFVVGGSKDWYTNMTGSKVQSQSTDRLVAANPGYTVQFNHVASADNLTLYKNNQAIITTDVRNLLNGSTKLGSVGSAASWDITLNVKADKVVLNVVGIAASGNRYTGSFEYSDSNPIYSGYTGVYFSAVASSTDGSTGTLYSMSIDTEASTKRKDDFYVAKTFGATDTSSSLESLGFTLDGTYTNSFSNSGIQLCQTGSSTTSTVMLDKYEFDGSYTVEVSAYFVNNFPKIYLNYQDAKNYYALDYGKPKITGDATSTGNRWGFILRECINGTTKDVAVFNINDDDDYEDINTANTVPFNRNYDPFKIEVTNSGGKLTFEITGLYRNVTYNETFVDESPSSTFGKVGYNATATGDTYLKSIKVYSAPLSYKAVPTAGEDVKLELPFMPWISSNGKVITAVYENDETKVFVDAQMVDLSSVKETEGVVLPAAKNVAAGKKIITFIWDSLEQMIPFVTPISAIVTE